MAQRNAGHRKKRPLRRPKFKTRKPNPIARLVALAGSDAVDWTLEKLYAYRRLDLKEPH